MKSNIKKTKISQSDLLWCVLHDNILKGRPHGLKIHYEVQEKLINLHEKIGHPSPEMCDNIYSTLSKFIRSRSDDTDLDYLILNAVLQAAIEHPELKKAFGLIRKGQPKLSPECELAKKLNYINTADRLKAIMQIRRSRAVSDFDLAREIELRIDGKYDLVDSFDLWPDDDRFAMRVLNRSKHLSEARKKCRELREAGYSPARASSAFNRSLLHGRQKRSLIHKWEPTEAELEGYPQWRDEIRKIRARATPPGRSRSRSPAP